VDSVVYLAQLIAFQEMRASDSIGYRNRRRIRELLVRTLPKQGEEIIRNNSSWSDKMAWASVTRNFELFEKTLLSSRVEEWPKDDIRFLAPILGDIINIASLEYFDEDCGVLMNFVKIFLNHYSKYIPHEDFFTLWTHTVRTYEQVSFFNVADIIISKCSLQQILELFTLALRARREATTAAQKQSSMGILIKCSTILKPYWEKYPKQQKEDVIKYALSVSAYDVVLIILHWFKDRAEQEAFVNLSHDFIGEVEPSKLDPDYRESYLGLKNFIKSSKGRFS
jgi:hypothetical protein